MVRCGRKTNSKTPSFRPKSFLQAIIDQGLAANQVDAAEAVVATGRYGEKAVIFFAQDGCPEAPDALAGFMIASKTQPAVHQNLSRVDAANIVGLLVTAYEFDVDIEDVPVTTYETRVVVS